jgi:hypothetical protein
MARAAPTLPATLPVKQGRKPQGPSQDNLDLVSMGLEALRRVGGVSYLETQAKARPRDFLAFLCRLAPLQIKADISNLEVVVHSLQVLAVPTPGVIASPVSENVLRLVQDNAREVAQEAAAHLTGTNDQGASRAPSG